MDMKIYKKTRYQNIYKHIKNGNYVISMSKPVKTSISKIDNKKIFEINEAIRIRDNVSIRQQKGLETVHKEDFDTLWKKYMDSCKYVLKLAYNTLNRKEKDYNRYLKGKISKSVSKTNKEFWSKYIDELECSNKQKNHILKIIKAFFNWCVDNNYLINNPVATIKIYKVEKEEMKYWTTDELKKFLDTLDKDINSANFKAKKSAFMIRTLALIGFNLGDRFGETRALTFNSFSKTNNTVTINHSINYDTKSNDFLSSTKNYQSQRVILVTDKLIAEIEKYKSFLKNECNYPVKDSSIIFFNYKTNKPYSDTNLRKIFQKYCEQANVTKIRVYDLRHTYVATMMTEGKELYQISERIGHSNYNTTVSKYGHLSNQIRKEIAQSTDKYY